MHLQHITVLLDEAVDALLSGAPAQPGGQWVDATFGRGFTIAKARLAAVTYGFCICKFWLLPRIPFR